MVEVVGLLLAAGAGERFGGPKALARDGFVALEPLPGARRVSVVTLTPLGSAPFAELAAAHHGWIDDLLGPLPHPVREALQGNLDTLKITLSEGKSA